MFIYNELLCNFANFLFSTNMVMNYTETEAKVRDATNEDPWGPTNQQMQEVSTLIFYF